jgi:hypothetical protein
MMKITAFTVLASTLAAVQAATIEHWWNITYVDANPNGVGLSAYAGPFVPGFHTSARLCWARRVEKDWECSPSLADLISSTPDE